MAQSPAQRQKALQKKANKRKQKAAQLRQQAQHQPARLDSKSQIQAAFAWPILETFLTRDWDEEGAIVQALVAREGSNGRIAVGVFLIDLALLGVKNSFVQMFESHAAYSELRTSVLESQHMVSADLNLIAKILRAAVEYAAQFGFRPNSDYRLASQMLAGADADASPVEIPTGGPEGKPLFIAGPHDNVEAILLRLEDRVGPDGYHYVMPGQDDVPGLGEWIEGFAGGVEDEDEDEEGEDGEGEDGEDEEDEDSEEPAAGQS
ncbi:hypothetical protein CCAX7_62590 [Capsulimonas corticalis]|uniref:Uncharacterized protein n=1 Tax=Capsulimonas corticalis TaxID=2219043 RepID=A0A402CWL6_9BACT|nr:hypothetical protein [Capsulimonas corticalis]BDI34208.1 hypothetical protein CCAX7_62590 [Capsulimonas corticalis]